MAVQCFKIKINAKNHDEQNIKILNKRGVSLNLCICKSKEYIPTWQDCCTELNERTDENVSGAPVSLKLPVSLAVQRVGVRLLRVTSQLRRSPAPMTLRTSFNICLK